MPTTSAQTRKRPVNLTLNVALVAQTKSYTGTLSATTESLSADFVDQQKQGQASRQATAYACAANWNAVHAAVGPFADEHSTLLWFA